MPVVLQWLRVALGAALALGGLALLSIHRWPGRPPGGPRLVRSSNRSRGRVSHPTRLLAGVLLLLAGFHAAVWAFPEVVMPLQLPRRQWAAWLVLGLGVILASLALDRIDRRGIDHDESRG